MSKRATAVVRLMACAAAVSACAGAGSGAEGSALCDALDAAVPGIDEIVWDNGLTRQEANWATLLDAGIRYSDEATRDAAADAVGSDTEGFERVLDAAPEPLRAHLELLRSVFVRPDETEKRRVDPAIVASIQAVRDATPPDVCGWVR